MVLIVVYNAWIYNFLQTNEVTGQFRAVNLVNILLVLHILIVLSLVIESR